MQLFAMRPLSRSEQSTHWAISAQPRKTLLPFLSSPRDVSVIVCCRRYRARKWAAQQNVKTNFRRNTLTNHSGSQYDALRRYPIYRRYSHDSKTASGCASNIGSPSQLIETPVIEHQYPNSRFRFAQWRILLATMFCYLFFYTGRQSFGFAIPGIQEDLGISKTTLGWAGTALLWSYALGQSINGNLGDKFGGRLMMSAGAVLSCGLNWVVSFGSNLTSLIIPWSANGFAQSMGWAPGSRVLSNWWGARGAGQGVRFLRIRCWHVFSLNFRHGKSDTGIRPRLAMDIPAAGTSVACRRHHVLRSRSESTGRSGVPSIGLR